VAGCTDKINLVPDNTYKNSHTTNNILYIEIRLCIKRTQILDTISHSDSIAAVGVRQTVTTVMSLICHSVTTKYT